MTRTFRLKLRPEPGNPSLNSTTFPDVPPTNHICNYCSNAIPNTSVSPLGCGPQPRPGNLTDSSGDIIICECCGTRLKNKGDWSRHLTNIHENVGKWFFCALCKLHAERELCNLASHMKTHFRTYKMTCKDPLPSGGLCALEFITPKEWHTHRKRVHGVELDPYLYTTSLRGGKQCRNLEADHTEDAFWAYMEEFSKGFPKEQARWICTRLPPILKSLRQFSPDGWPYFVVFLSWADLGHASIRTSLRQIQTRHSHVYCMKELEAIEAICTYPSSILSSSSPPCAFPTSLPRIVTSSSSSFPLTHPLAITCTSPTTLSSDLGKHPIVYPPDPNYDTLALPLASRLSSSAHGQPFLSSFLPLPSLPSLSSTKRRSDCSDSNSGHRYDPYSIPYRTCRSPELMSRSQMQAWSPHLHPLRPAHFSPRKDYCSTVGSALRSPSPIFSSHLQCRGFPYVEDGHDSQASRSSSAQSRYQGYTPEALAKSSAFFRTVLAEDSR